MEVDRESDRAFDRQMWWATAFGIVVSAACVAAALAVIVFWASPAKGAEPPRAWTEAPPPKVKAACICGDSCACKPGVCPKGCPLTYADAVARVAKGERVYLSVGKRVETVKVCVGGTCRMVPVTAHTDSLNGFPEGVYECYLLNGSPVMQRR